MKKIQSIKPIFAVSVFVLISALLTFLSSSYYLRGNVSAFMPWFNLFLVVPAHIVAGILGVVPIKQKRNWIFRLVIGGVFLVVAYLASLISDLSYMIQYARYASYNGVLNPSVLVSVFIPAALPVLYCLFAAQDKPSGDAQ